MKTIMRISTPFFMLALVIMLALQVYANPLEKELKEKQSIANTQKAKIQELTLEERKIRIDLQQTEKSMRDTEKLIAQQRAILSKLQQKEKQIAYHIEYLKKQQEKREENIAVLLNTLWPLRLKQYTNDAEEKDAIYNDERTYIWIQYIMHTIDEEHKALALQKQETEIALEEQRNNAAEQRNTIATLNSQVQTLRTVTLEYRKKLQAVQEVKKSAEEELRDIVKIIVSIENKLQEKLNVGKITASTQGKLPLPVVGKISIGYQPRATPPIKGVGFSTVKGAKVTSVADGTVVHNDVLRGFGRVIIIAHGNLYYSIYAFLSSANVAVNKNVKQGEVLGITGYYPSVNSDGLYFELRKNETTINPTLWFKK